MHSVAPKVEMIGNHFFSLKKHMLKNIITLFTIAAISATGIIYARPTYIADSMELKTTDYEPSTFVMATKISPTEYAIAGQSGQVIAQASESAAVDLAIAPQTVRTSVQQKQAIEATASAENLSAVVEPAVKPPDSDRAKAIGQSVTSKEIVATAKPVSQTMPYTPSPMPPSELDALFQKYGAEYGVSWEKLKAIAKCESGFNAAVVSKNGLYGGLFQYVASTWSGTRKQMGLDPNPDLRFNAEEAIRTTAYKISVGGTGPWPHCGKK